MLGLGIHVSSSCLYNHKALLSFVELSACWLINTLIQETTQFSHCRAQVELPSHWTGGAYMYMDNPARCILCGSYHTWILAILCGEPVGWPNTFCACMDAVVREHAASCYMYMDACCAASSHIHLCNVLDNTHVNFIGFTLVLYIVLQWQDHPPGTELVLQSTCTWHTRGRKTFKYSLVTMPQGSVHHSLPREERPLTIPPSVPTLSPELVR